MFSNTDQGSRIRFFLMPDLGSASNIFLLLKYFNNLMGIRDWVKKIRIRDGKKSYSGTGINNPDPQYCIRVSDQHQNCCICYLDGN
jgi:hypothetical protein